MTGERPPTRLRAAVFAAKAMVLRLCRTAADLAGGPARLERGDPADYPAVIAESRTPLWSEHVPTERALELGKVQNLRAALLKLHGTALPPGAVFSFWKQVGRATRRRGFVEGRQLLEGCLIPAVGGGLCQLSNALYDVALRAGLEVVERHPHSRLVPGSVAETGRDATVAWNYVDLRFRSSAALLIEARLTSEELIVRLRGRAPAPTSPHQPFTRIFATADERAWLDPWVHSCATCRVGACFRRREPAECAAGRTAFVVDECWPELRRYVAAGRGHADVLCLPLDGGRWRQPRYGWETKGFECVATATTETVRRSLATRRLGSYGAARLQAQLDGAAALAARLARGLTPDVTAVVAAQSLLPFLWREGHLGGRRFEVLMTRLPLAALHARLDQELAAHPERETLGEFHAPDWLVAAETAALAEADRIITPHADVAAPFGRRALRLDWHVPPAAAEFGRLEGDPLRQTKPVIAFPGPTAARKGAYELRAAAADLDAEVLLLGSELEGEEFWEGLPVRRADRSPPAAWLAGVTAVVQPALVEDQPRALLAALAAGVPVVATRECGLGDRAGVMTVPQGDAAAPRNALRAVVDRSV